MRPLPASQRRRSALASVGGHGVLFALLASIDMRGTPPRPVESPLIMAELVTALESAVPATRVEDAVPVATEPQPEANERAAEEPAPQSPPSEPELVTPAPPPSPTPPAEREIEPAPPEPPPVERFAETPSPEPVPEPAAPPEEVPPTPAAAGPAPDPAPTRALARHEERAVRSRLSSWTGRFDPDEPDATLKWREAGQEYTAILERVPATEATGMEQLAVELTTERDGERLVTELRMSRLAFSNFGQFVNRWDPDVQIHDDVIDGRLHSNTALTIGRSGGTTPIFRGKVTIADGGYNTPGPGFISERKLFPAGVETRARRIALPERAAALETIAGVDNSQRFAHDTALTFHADGTVSWRGLEPGSTEARRSLGDEPFYLIADEDVDFEVSGTVNGKVLVYTPERIVITADLRYAVDPRTPQADDYLGLVAERTVEIAEPDVTGPGDLTVFASIYARQRFVVRSFNARRSGTLIIHGSLTAGTLTATEPRFASRIEFDHRLTTMRAPHFPLSDRYELDSTSLEWRVVGAADSR